MKRTIRFSTDPAKYLPVVFTRFEGTEVMNYSPLLYAFEQEDIAVTGRGTLDGQGSRDNWWGWTSKARADISALVKMGGEDVPVASACLAKVITCVLTCFSPAGAPTFCLKE